MRLTHATQQGKHCPRIVISCQHHLMPTTAHVPAAEPGVHPLYLRLLSALLKQRGVLIDDLMRSLDPTAHVSDADVSVAALQILVPAAIQRSGSPWLGLELGAAAQAISHGPVGFAAAASGSLRQALDVAIRFIALRAPVLRLSAQRGARFTHLSIAENADLGVARRFVFEASAVMLVQLLESMAGRRLIDLRIELPWSEPAWSRHYAAYLSGERRFDARDLRMRFPNELLDAPCLSADPQAFELARQECERRLQAGAAERDLSSRLRRLLWQCEGRYPSAEASAAQFGVSLRMLYRGLAAAGSSFRELLDEARSDRAKRLLTESNEPVEAIAERLGYADASNFSRCFRRWTGTTPRAFRRTQGPPS